MKSFAGVADSVDEVDVEVFGGREKVVSLMARLDSSWESTSRLTLSVFLAVMACSSDKAVAEKCLSGMLGLMGKMSDAYCFLLGWQGELIDQSELAAISERTDEAGREMAKGVTGLGGAVMVGMLAPLPRKWTDHYRSLVDARGVMTRVLSSRCVSHLSALMVEAQKGNMGRLARMADRSVFSPNSRPSIQAMAWAKAAGAVYDAVLAGGYRGDVALAEAVRKVGFPDAKGGSNG